MFGGDMLIFGVDDEIGCATKEHRWKYAYIYIYIFVSSVRAQSICPAMPGTLTNNVSLARPEVLSVAALATPDSALF